MKILKVGLRQGRRDQGTGEGGRGYRGGVEGEGGI